MRALLAFALLGCQAGDPAEDQPAPDRDATLDPLELPDTDGLDFEAAFTDALRLALSVNAQAAWRGHVASLALRHTGCPDLWSGAPDNADIRGQATSWVDHCSTPGGLTFDGYVSWDSTAVANGAPSSPEGRVQEASRILVADGSVGTPEGLLFELDGRASDSFYIVENELDGERWSNWTYNSLVQGTVTGSEAFAGSPTPRGWRTDLYLSLMGGDYERLEARGNVYLFEPVLHARFDSLAMDLAYAASPTPGACPAEPLGWIGLRDSDAYWYDLVFLPRTQEDAVSEAYENEPLSMCDGCGTLYIRGVESGEVCLDFDFLFDDFEPPEVADFVLSLHDLP